jgi:hypothetical protein
MMPNPTLARPEPSEYAPDFGKYIQLVPEGNVQAFLAAQREELMGLLAGVPEHESTVPHPPYTWTIKQVVGHVTDCERIFGHRALRLSRGDATPLATFDENAYMQSASFDRWPLAELADEFDLVRRGHLSLFRHLEPEAWLRRGVVNDHPTTARAMAWAIAGHTDHHLRILHRRIAR